MGLLFHLNVWGQHHMTDISTISSDGIRTHSPSINSVAVVLPSYEWNLSSCPNPSSFVSWEPATLTCLRKGR
jgi:hypothetical protein